MRAIIPVKRSSTRVPNKNFRPFYDGKSLVEIKLGQLTTCLPPDRIYLSSEDPTVAEIADAWGANFLLRDEVLARNETPYAQVVAKVCSQLPPAEDIAWCHVTDPMFTEYPACFDTWLNRRQDHDALTVVYPFRAYILDGQYNPLGFGFGPWHRSSQTLPPLFQLGFTLSILRYETATSLGPIGARTLWFHASNRLVDIDDESDFALAQGLFALAQEPEASSSSAKSGAHATVPPEEGTT